MIITKSEFKFSTETLVLYCLRNKTSYDCFVNVDIPTCKRVIKSYHIYTYFFVASYMYMMIGDYKNFIDSSTHLHHMQGRCNHSKTNKMVPLKN